MLCARAGVVSIANLLHARKLASALSCFTDFANVPVEFDKGCGLFIWVVEAKFIDGG